MTELPKHGGIDPYEGLQDSRALLDTLAQREDIRQATEDVAELSRILQSTQHPLYQLPEGSDDALWQQQLDLQTAMLTFTDETRQLNFKGLQSKHVQLIATMAQDLLQQVQAYEAQANRTAREQLVALLDDASTQPYLRQLQEKLGIEGGATSFVQYLRFLTEPVSRPQPAERGAWSDEDLAELTQHYRQLQRDQHVLIDSVINLSLLNLRDADRYPNADWVHLFNEADRKNVLVAMADFMHRRLVYESHKGRVQREDSDMFQLYATAAGIELSEEFFEGMLNFGKPTKTLQRLNTSLNDALGKAGKGLGVPEFKAAAVVRSAEVFEGLSPSLRARLLAGYEGAKSMLGKSAPPLRSVVHTIKSSPVGKEFWNRLMTIESPVTVVLFMIYVNQSSNRLKAAMNFASFMTLSAGTSAFMETWGATLWRQGTLRSALWAKRQMQLAQAAGNTQRARALGGLYRSLRLSRVAPKNPAVQMTVMLLVAFGAAKHIDQFTTWLDEEVLSDGPMKYGTTEGLNMLSGGTIIESASYLAREVGTPGLQVDPERDVIEYISQDLLTMRKDDGHWLPHLQREKTGRKLEWNAAVDRAIAAEWNPLAQKLYAEEKMTAGWQQRQAFRYFGMVQRARVMEGQLLQAMVTRDVLPAQNTYGLVDWATSDEGDQWAEQAIAFVEDNEKFPESTVRSHISALRGATSDEDKALVALWDDYRLLTEDIAKLTTVYRHLGVYDKEQWLGANRVSGMRITPFVQQGIAEEITYRMRRDEALVFRKKGKQVRAAFARNIAALTSHELKKIDVSNTWFSDLFTFDGTVTHMSSHFYKRAFIAAAEAAAIALPEDHDINALFAELRFNVANKRTVTQSELMAMRDNFCDAVRAFSEKNHAYVSAPAHLAEGLSSVPSSRLFYSEQIDKRAFADMKQHGLPETWPADMVQLVLGQRIEQEAQQGRADIALVQQLIPAWGQESHYRLNIMTLTCIEAVGSKPADWLVHIHRYQTARDLPTENQSVKKLQTTADWGESSSMPFLQWAQAHPRIAKTINSAVQSVQILHGKTPEQTEQAQISAAEEAAKTSTQEFVHIPYKDQYKRSHHTGMITLKGLPYIGSGQPTPYRFHVQHGAEGRDYRVGMGDLDSESLTAQDKRLIRDVVTTPIPGHEQETVEGVMHLFGFYYRPAYGSTPELSAYTTVRRTILREYKAADPSARKAFMERFLQLSEHYMQVGDRTEQMIDLQEAERISAWFVRNRELYQKATLDQRQLFMEGERIIGRWPESNGTYKVPNAKGGAFEHAWFYYQLGSGWLWHPGTDRNPQPKTWYPVSRVNIPLERDESTRQVSLSGDAMKIRRQLDALQNGQ